MTPRTQLPAPAARRSRQQVVHAMERWKKWLYHLLPGAPLTLDEFGQLTRQLVLWCNRHARFVDVRPLKQFWERTVQRSRIAAGQPGHWEPPAGELEALWYEAVGELEHLKTWLNAGGGKDNTPGRKPRGGGGGERAQLTRRQASILQAMWQRRAIRPDRLMTGPERRQSKQTPFDER